MLVGIARDMEELCPDAWMLNITNPMTTLCRAVTRETTIKTVGLCHEVADRAVLLSLLLDADFRAIELEVTGVNHLPIITALRVDGDDGLRAAARAARRPDRRRDDACRSTCPPRSGHEPGPDGGRVPQAATCSTATG